MCVKLYTNVFYKLLSFRTEFCNKFCTDSFFRLNLWFLIVVLLLWLLCLFFMFFVLIFLLSFFIFHLNNRFINPSHHSFDGFFLVFFDFKLINIHSMCPLFAARSLKIQFVIISATSSPTSLHHSLVSIWLIIRWDKPPRVRLSFMAIIALWPIIFLIQLIYGLNLGFSFAKSFQLLGMR